MSIRSLRIYKILKEITKNKLRLVIVPEVYLLRPNHVRHSRTLLLVLDPKFCSEKSIPKFIRNVYTYFNNNLFLMEVYVSDSLDETILLAKKEGLRIRNILDLEETLNNILLEVKVKKYECIEKV
jgi:hypothetical protein